jgi:phasin
VDEAVQTTYPKAKSKPIAAPSASAFELSKLFEFPKFAMPNFELSKIEVPAEFREFAEKSVSQAKGTYEKMKSAAQEASAPLENTYAIATKGASDYGLKVIDAMRANTNSAFDFCTELTAAKSFSEAIELSTAHSRKQFRGIGRPKQGTRCARAKGHDRDLRAGEGKLHQGAQDSGVHLSLLRGCIFCPSPGFSVSAAHSASSQPHLNEMG